MSDKSKRIKRGRKFKAINKQSPLPVLSVHRTPRHIYVQLIDKKNSESKVLASASTLHKDFRSISGNKTDKAKAIGKAIGEKTKSLGIESVIFDRCGFRFHGRVKALADAARESGIQF